MDEILWQATMTWLATVGLGSMAWAVLGLPPTGLPWLAAGAAISAFGCAVVEWVRG